LVFCAETSDKVRARKITGRVKPTGFTASKNCFNDLKSDNLNQ
jgi:hypothetical protein